MVSPVEVDQPLLDGRNEQSSRSKRNEDVNQAESHSSKKPGSKQRNKRHTPDWIAGSDGR
jgi:hypothetical protein